MVGPAELFRRSISMAVMTFGIAAVAVFRHHARVKVIETGGDDDCPDILPRDLVFLAEIDRVQLAAGVHALVAVDAGFLSIEYSSGTAWLMGT